MKIQQFIFRQIAKRQPQRKKVFRNFEDVKSILIIFESDYIERNPFIKEVINKLKTEGKEVDAWGYVDKKDSTTSTIAPFSIICNKDISTLLKRPKKEKLAELLAKHYDLLLDLRTQSCLPLQYMTLYAQADLKAGAEVEDAQTSTFRILDFMVKLPQKPEQPNEIDPQILLNELIYYIKTIRQHA